MSAGNDDLVNRLWASDKASALTSQAARRIEADAKLIQEMREALIFYSHEPIYHHRYETRSCGCCSDTFEPEILDDLGAVAREALAKSQQEGETE